MTEETITFRIPRAELDAILDLLGSAELLSFVDGQPQEDQSGAVAVTMKRSDFDALIEILRDVGAEPKISAQRR